MPPMTLADALLQQPQPGQPVLGQAPTQADAWDYNTDAVGNAIAAQRAISEQRGLWANGAPTQAGVMDAAGQLGQSLLMGSTAPGIRAFHGSPHSFDQFSLDKIGTGEGAQAYGHGLYFAGNEGVAQGYRDALAPGFTPTLNGAPLTSLPGPMRQVAQWMRNTGAHPDEIAAIADQRAAKALADGKAMGLDDLAETMAAEHSGLADAARSLSQGGRWELGSAPNGHMYEVNLNANPEHMLDWDKPLSEQPAPLQAIAETIRQGGGLAAKKLGPDATGADLYHSMRSPFSSKALGYENWSSSGPSEHLLQAGIPGIRYLDAGSRGAGEGTSNYVMFNPEHIAILRKYGLLGTAGGAAASPFGFAAAGQDQQ